MPTAATSKPGISTAPVAKKLLIKPGFTIGVLNAPDGFRKQLEPLPDGATVTDRPGADMDVVIGFLRNESDLKKVAPAAGKAVRPDGLLWLCYLKGGAKAGTDLNRDVLRDKAASLGLEGVSLVAVDDAWSAMRFKKR